MSRLREAAALLVEQGRAIGRLEQARLVLTHVARESAAAARLEQAETAARFIGFARGLGDAIERLEHDAAAAQARAAALMAALEHPGAALARRLVTAWRGARVAWRAAR